jgi:hypothetical protein
MKTRSQPTSSHGAGNRTGPSVWTPRMTLLPKSRTNMDDAVIRSLQGLTCAHGVHYCKCYCCASHAQTVMVGKCLDLLFFPRDRMHLVSRRGLLQSQQWDYHRGTRFLDDSHGRHAVGQLRLVLALSVMLPLLDRQNTSS